MTPQDSMPGKHDCGTDAAAYVLGALEPREAEAFRRHLAECVVCRDEVAAFQQVADALVMAPAQQAAPRELRGRVLDAVRAEQEQAGAPERRPVRARFGGWIPRPAIALTGVLAVAAALVIGLVLGSSGGSSASRVIAASVAGSPGSAQLRVAGGRADLVLHDFPQPASGHIYEMWELRSGARAPSPTRTLFSVSSGGEGNVGVPGDLEGISKVLVTQEPAGGSPAPTRTPVVVASLS
jgi:anti-sigma-K factor RskA